MKSPFTGGKVVLKKEVRKFEYRKEKFPVYFHFYQCVDSGEQFTDTSLDTLNINQVHNKYRSKFGIPFVEEIKGIRENYGLSAAKMSEVLGLGINVYRQYENGEMPSVATGRLIRLAQDPAEFKRLLEICEAAFEPPEFDRILRKINQTNQAADVIDEKLYFYLFESKFPNMLNGFRMPDIKRIASMILFFAQENKPYTTALNKLMFYADFSHFKQYGVGISGLCYKAIQRGPVPNNYGSVYNYLLNKGLVTTSEVTFQDFVGDQFYSNVKIQFDVTTGPFIASELAVLKMVSKRFKGMTTKEIVHISHHESAWQNNVDDAGRINYEYGFELKEVDK